MNRPLAALWRRRKALVNMKSAIPFDTPVTGMNEPPAVVDSRPPSPGSFSKRASCSKRPPQGAGGRGGHGRSRAGGAQTGFFWRELSCQLTHAKIVYRHMRIQNMLIISTERYISDSVYLLMYINFAAMARNI